ncbi:MAG: hypothetical protein JSV16_16240, partial [Candidatus Hydrogenedentota bacterium]
MKSLTAIAASHCSSQYNEPVLLLELDWSDTDTGRYAERPVSIDGVAYTAVIRKVGPIACSFDDPASEYKPVSIQLFPEDALRGRI